MTIREALQEANTKINPLDSSLLLICSLSQSRQGAEIDRSHLLTMHDEELSEQELLAFHKLVERRKGGECVAYITGKKEFWGLEFFVNEYVLVPRPETELLIEAALQLIRNEEVGSRNNEKAECKVRILDLCTGSGAIAIALKHEIPDLEVFATDISAEALEVAKKNAANLLPNNNNITFLQGDLYNALPCPLSPVPCPLFSLIVSNPPYIETSLIKTLLKEVQLEPHLALDGGKTGLEIVERIINDAPKYLEKGGHLLMEINSRPGYTEKTKKLFADKGFSDIIVYKDLAGLDRVIGGKFE